MDIVLHHLTNMFWTKKAWTLHDCVQFGLKNNLTIQQFELDVKSSGKKILQEYGNLLPTLNLSANQNYNFGLTIDPSTNARVSSDIRSNNFSVNGELRLFDWGNFIRIKRARLQRDKAKYDLEAQKNTVLLEIIRLFYQLQYDKEQLTVIENQLLNTQKQIERIEQEVKEGGKSKSDLYDVLANMATEKQQKIQFENNHKTSYVRLQNVLDLKDSVDFAISPSEEIEKEKNDLENLYQKSFHKWPEIKSSELSRDLQKKVLQESRSALYPVINANYSYSTFYVRTLNGVNVQNIPFSVQFNNNMNQFAGFSMNILIFNGLKTRAQIATAKIDLEKANRALDLEKQLYYETLKEAWQQNENAYRTWVGSIQNVVAQNTSFVKVEKRFETGLIDAFSYFNSKNTLLNAEYQSLRAKYEFLYSNSILKFYSEGTL